MIWLNRSACAGVTTTPSPRRHRRRRIIIVVVVYADSGSRHTVAIENSRRHRTVADARSSVEQATRSRDETKHHRDVAAPEWDAEARRAPTGSGGSGTTRPPDRAILRPQPRDRAVALSSPARPRRRSIVPRATAAPSLRLLSSSLARCAAVSRAAARSRCCRRRTAGSRRGGCR